MELKILAATVLLALPATSAEPPLPQLRIEPTTGGSIFYVKNVSPQPLTGYLIELVDYPGSSYVLWQDEIGVDVFGPGGITPDPIGPDKEKRIQVGNMTVGAVPDYVKIQAAVYADGSTAGIHDKVEQLIARRSFTLKTVRETIGRLEKAQGAKEPKDALIADLRQKAGLMVAPKGAPTSQLVINQVAGRVVLAEAVVLLATESVEQTLAALRIEEAALAASKPGLE